MRVTVIFFGPARDAAGTESVELELADDATIATLAADLTNRFPRFAKGIASVRFAVSEAFVGNEHSLAEGDEVAVIPPVSGGAPVGDLVELTDKPLDSARIHSHLATAPPDRCGGVCIFDGRTRFEKNKNGDPLVALKYEAHADMAVRQMRTLAESARQRWAIGAIVIAHRTGVVPMGESSVIIAVACGHRAQAFEACRWLIDELKKDVTIWKKEVWSTGEKTWVDPKPSTEPRP